MKRFFLAYLLCIICNCHLFSQREQRAKLLLVAFDGFRAEYLDRGLTPTFNQMADDGARAISMVPVFPSKTFPNHYSIVTGLYSEHHGILANRMYDPQLDAWFRIGAGSQSTRDERWFLGEPIWVTAEKQGLASATFFWPGSDAPIEGIMPSYHHYYDGRIPYEHRIDTALHWLSLEQGPDLITLYFESPDKEGHAYGPESTAVDQALQRMDLLLKELLTGIDSLGLTNKVNLMVVSDHGMASLSPERIIFLDDFIDMEEIRLVDVSPKADIIPNRGKKAKIYRQLKGAHPHLKVYRRKQIPKRFHYRSNRRITPLVALADEGWSITTREAFALKPNAFNGGAHGYDPISKNMHAILICKGPAFRAGAITSTIENIHLYAMMCHLLGLKPAKHDGNLSQVLALLEKQPSQRQ